MLEFIESPIFSKTVHDLLEDDELARMQLLLSRNPESVDLVPGSGGCRKLRWGMHGGGKRGGVRTIYYSQTAQGRIWLLIIYAKTTQASVPARAILELRNKLVRASR